MVVFSLLLQRWQIKALRWLPRASALLSWAQQPAVTQTLGLARHLEWSGCVWSKTSRCVWSECLLMHAWMVSFIIWIQGMNVNVSVEFYPVNQGRIPWVLGIVYWLSITQVFLSGLFHPFWCLCCHIFIAIGILHLSADTTVESPITSKEKWFMNSCWYSASCRKELSNAAVTSRARISAW